MSTLLFTHFLKVIGEKLGIEDTLHGSYEKNPIYLGKNKTTNTYAIRNSLLLMSTKCFKKIHRLYRLFKWH